MRTLWLIVGVCVIAGCASQPPAHVVWPDTTPSNSVVTNENTSLMNGTIGSAPLSYHWNYNGSNDNGTNATPVFAASTITNTTPATGLTSNSSPHQVELPMETASPFQNYDRGMIDTIQQHWRELRKNYPNSSTGHAGGKVVVSFRLHSDGRISNIKIVSSDVNELLTYLCDRAVTDPAPYPAWPSEMLRQIGEENRLIRFTFSYD